MIDIPDYDNLLIPPVIVSDDYWKKGYFYTISNIPLTEEEKSIDFGFLKFISKLIFSVKKMGKS
ncbi:Imm26 family immunity protein [Streptococcus pluranimalium]|uniref:Imm26 family immunity protein n=1 Tax=Streptococcus pluranimalium TaxID=82348 RepID=UPI0039FDC585